MTPKRTLSPYADRITMRFTRSVPADSWPNIPMRAPKLDGLKPTKKLTDIDSPADNQFTSQIGGSMNPLAPSTTVESLRTDLSGSPEQSYITPDAANTGSFESFVVTFPAFASAVQGMFLRVIAADGNETAIWFDLDANGTEPNGAIYSATDDKIEVDIVTGNTAAQVAAAALAAIDDALDGAFTIVNSGSGTLTFTSAILGNITNSVGYHEDEVTASPITVAITAGTAAADQNQYFVLRDDDTGLFHVWLNVNGEGVDPDPGGGSVGIEVAVAAGASLATVTAAIAAAIDAHAEFEAEVDGTRVKVTTATNAAVTDLGAGDIGYTVAVSTQGGAALKPSPATAVDSLTNT